MRPVYKYTAVAAAAGAVFILSLFVLISDGLVEGIVRKALEEEAGISFNAKDFKKGFPLGFKANGVKLSNKEGKGGKGGVIVEMEELDVHLAVFPLIAGEKKLSYTARLGNGTIEGTAIIKESAEINVIASNVELNAVVPLRAFGFEDGSVSGRASFFFLPAGCPKGKVSLDATGIDTNALKSPWPAMIFGEKISASLEAYTTADCTARIKGLFIKGRSLNARLEGVIKIKNPLKRSALDIKAEIFIKPGATDMTMLLPFIKEYKKSSGYYLFSLNGTIENPVIKKLSTNRTR